MEMAATMFRRLLGKVTAAEHKQRTESQIAALRAEADRLVGKEHHKERAAKGKIIAQLRSQDQYIDACRVAKGLAPLHGHYANEAAAQGAGAAGVDAEEAARLAAEAERALKKLDNATGARDQAASSGRTKEAEELLRGWSRRAAKLEAKMAEPLEAAPKSVADADELERIAQEVMDYRRRCGGQGKDRDIVEDRDLQLLEARLDTLAGAFPPADQRGPSDIEAEAKELREWEQRLVAKLAHQGTGGLKPSAAKEVERLLAEVAELKATLGAQGLTENEQDKDERVLTRLTRLAELRQYDHRDKKQERRERQELEGVRREIEQLVAKVQAHKHRLREEKGYSQKDLKRDPEVCELEERLSTLQRMGGA